MYHEIFQAAVKENPESIAAQIEDGAALTYAQLELQSNLLAQHLIKNGVKPGDSVAVFLQRTLLPLIVKLAISKAGGVYVPVTPQQTPNQVKTIINETPKLTHFIHESKLYGSTKSSLNKADGISALLKDKDIQTLDAEAIVNSFEQTECKAPDLEGLSRDSLAYIVHSSGSTGKKKGIIHKHNGFAYWARVLSNHIPDIKKIEHVSASVSHDFDAQFAEEITAFVAGATLHITSEATRKDHIQFAEFIKAHKISDIMISPGMLNIYTPTELAEMQKAGLRRVSVTGSSCKEETYQKCFSAGLIVFNCYGPTEIFWGLSMIDASTKPFINGRAPIEIPDTTLSGKNPVSVAILAEKNLTTKDGAQGELVVATDFLTQGYTNESIKNRLYTDPATKITYYRTGDKFLLKDGVLHYQTRISKKAHVKINSQFVSLEGVENAMEKFDGIVNACVVVPSDRPIDEPVLVAFYSASKRIKETALREHLMKSLGQASTPAFFTKLKKMPLNSSGKLDRSTLSKHALPTTSLHLDSKRTIPEPSTLLESELIKIWQEILNIRDNIDTNTAFELFGGTSIHRSQLSSMIAKRFEMKFSVAELGRPEKLSIKRLAEKIITKRVMTNLDKYMVNLTPGDNSSAPLFFLPPVTGDVTSYESMATEIAEHGEINRPIYAIQSPGLTDPLASQIDFVNIAKLYAKMMHAVQDKTGQNQEEPLHVAGWSTGGTFAFEVARQEELINTPLGYLGIIDQLSPLLLDGQSSEDFILRLFFILKLVTKNQPELSKLIPEKNARGTTYEGLSKAKQIEYLFNEIRNACPDKTLPLFLENLRCTMIAETCYEEGQKDNPKKLKHKGMVSLYVSAKSQEHAKSIFWEDDAILTNVLGWTPAHAETALYQLKGDHFSIINDTALITKFCISKGMSTDLSPPSSPAKRKDSSEELERLRQEILLREKERDEREAAKEKERALKQAAKEKAQAAHNEQLMKLLTNIGRAVQAAPHPEAKEKNSRKLPKITVVTTAETIQPMPRTLSAGNMRATYVDTASHRLFRTDSSESTSQAAAQPHRLNPSPTPVPG